MANTRKTMVTYRGTGTQKTFAFNFDYLQKSFIKVSIDGKVLTYGIDYTVTNRQVDLLVAPVVDVLVIVYRETATSRLVSWEDASVLRAADMTLFEVQLLHIAEETQDKVQDSGLALDPEDNVWDARFHKIKNVNDPEKPEEVVTKRYFESIQAGYVQALTNLLSDTSGQAQAATTKATEAANSASAAKTSETNAKASENAAAGSATAASNSASASAGSATAASNSASIAATKATEAVGSASTATTKAQEASNSATAAAASATQASNNAGYTKAQADSLFTPNTRFGPVCQMLPQGYNLDNLLTNGQYMCMKPTAPGSNWTSNGWFYIEVLAHNNDHVYQRVIPFSSSSRVDCVAFSRLKDIVWYPWIYVGNRVSIITGEIGHGGTIPLPSGYPANECKFFVSPKQDHNVSWDVNEGSTDVHYRTDCWASADRVVFCATYISEKGGWQYGIANYIVIGVN